MEFEGKPLRHELKYYINEKEYESLRNRIRPIISLDKNADENGNYHIRSLYFDDMYDSSLYEKNYGVFKRKKYRIRIYDFSSKVIKLECKSKFGEYISKDSVSLSLDEYNRIMDGDYGFLFYETGLKQEFFRRIKDGVLRPKVIVDYRREAYIYNPGDVRITFDKELSVGYNSNDIFNKDLSCIGIFGEPTIILEIKFDEFLPQFIRGLLSISSHERCAVSKYLMCRVKKNNIY